MPPPPNPLRFGIVCDNMTIERWQAKCVERLVSTRTASLVQVISYESSRTRPARSAGSRLLRIYRGSFGTPRQTEIVRLNSIIPRLASSPGIIIENEGSGETDLRDRTRKITEKLRPLNIDFILHFGSEPIQEEITKLPRYGVWIFRNPDGSRHHGRPDCFWQVYNGDYVTGAVLTKLGGAEPAVLWEGRFKTIRESYPRNLDQVLRSCVYWPTQVCLKLQKDRSITSERRINITTGQRQYRIPGTTHLLLLGLKTFKRRIGSFYRLLFRYTSWNVGIVESPINSFLDPEFKPAKIYWLPQPGNGHIQADPFGKETDQGLNILYERMDYRHRRGAIFAVKVSREGDRILSSRPILAIQQPVHMSYPYLVEFQGETYCFPETNRAREVPIYKATSLDKWEKIGSLLKGIQAIDTTIFQHEGRWWAMFTDRERGGDANLYAYHSQHIWGPWHPHSLNPVKTDVQSARPAGTPFMHMGQLYRPSMDCSRTGGGRIIINRIERLTPDEFEESQATIIEPYRDSPYPVGIHTLSSAGQFTLIDGKRFRFYPSGLLSNILKALRRL